MIGCEFCRMEENGDFGFDLKPWSKAELDRWEDEA